MSGVKLGKAWEIEDLFGVAGFFLPDGKCVHNLHSREIVYLQVYLLLREGEGSFEGYADGSRMTEAF